MHTRGMTTTSRNTGPEQWVPAALAAQREHEKRSRSCRGQVGRAHSFRTFGIPTRPAVRISRCIDCGVTETQADYDATQEASRA